MVGHDTTVEHRTFVALGDSFTEGLEDDLGPDGRHLGWADRVAAALATREGGLRYANLAVRGQAARPGGRRAGAGGPGAAAGPGVLPRRAQRRAPAGPGRRRRRRAATTRRSAGLVAPGVQVLLFTVIERAGGTGRTAARLAERFAPVQRRRTPDGASAPARWSSTSVPSRRCRTAGSGTRTGCTWRAAGHARVAAAVLETLGVTEPGLLGGEPGWWREPLAPGVRPGRRADVLADVRWVRRYLAPWVGRRLRGASSGDGLSPKHLELVDVVPARAGRVSRR